MEDSMRVNRQRYDTVRLHARIGNDMTISSGRRNHHTAPVGDVSFRIHECWCLSFIVMHQSFTRQWFSTLTMCPAMRHMLRRSSIRHCTYIVDLMHVWVRILFSWKPSYTIDSVYIHHFGMSTNALLRPVQLTRHARKCSHLYASI